MSEDGWGDMPGRRQGGPSSAVSLHPADDNDLLAEILYRLPVMPSSLCRASLVCKRWRRLVSDPYFLRRFRAHHRKPPLLGFFSRDFCGTIEFTSVLDPPDHVSAARFSLQAGVGSKILCSRHGRVLVLNQEEQHILVWDPVTGELRYLAFPSVLDGKVMFVKAGGVLCAASDQGHVHGACHSDPFRVVLVGEEREGFFACVYSSETRAWGNLFAIMRPNILTVSPICPSTLSRNSICLLLFGEKAAILEFDWDRQNLAVIDVPSDAHDFDAFLRGECQFLIKPADSGGLSFILLAVFSVRVWKTMSNGDGVARWMLGNTIELSNLLLLRSTVDMVPLRILGLNEEGNVMFYLTDSGAVFVVHLESMQFKKLPQKLSCSNCCHPFSSFYTPGSQSLFLLPRCRNGLSA